MVVDDVGFNTLLNVNQLKHFKKKTGLPEEYSPGMPLTRQIIDLTQKITDDLRQFKVNRGEDLPLLRIEDGQAKIPSNYYVVSTLQYPVTAKDRPIEILPDVLWSKRMGSSLQFPDHRFPIANFQKDFIRFAPKSIKYVKFIYYRYPKQVKYAIKGLEYPRSFPAWNYIYDEANSIQLEWDDINIIDIIYLMLQDLSITVDKKEVLQYANILENKGA